jgi:hypothetical protein
MTMLLGKRMLPYLVVLLTWFSAARGLAQDRTESSNASRVAVTSAIAVGVTAMTIGVGIAAAQHAMDRCVDRSFGLGALGCGASGAAVLGAVGIGVLPLALTLGTYLPHRGLDGRGKWYAAFAGTAVGMIAGSGVLAAALGVSDSRASVTTGLVLGGLLAASVPVLALELSHKRRLKLERAPRMVPVASAVPSGAWVGVAGTL